MELVEVIAAANGKCAHTSHIVSKWYFGLHDSRFVLGAVMPVKVSLQGVGRFACASSISPAEDRAAINGPIAPFLVA
jgi:hypothetical protein